MSGPWQNYGPWTAYEQEEDKKPANKDTRPPLQRFLNDLGTGAVRGAGSIGATLMAPQDMLQDFIRRKLGGPDQNSNQQRRQDMTDALQSVGANPDSLAFQGAKTLTEVAGTLGVGSALANPLSRVLPSVAPAVASAGFTLGRPAATTLAGRAGDLGTRAAGGAITGGAAAGLVNPEDALTGAALGAALPGAVGATGALARATGRGLQNAAAVVSDKAASRVAQRQMQEALGGVPNVQQGVIPLSTAAATGNVEAAMLEQASRLRNPELWAPFDSAQQGEVWSKLLSATDEASLLGNRRLDRSQNWDGRWNSANAAFDGNAPVSPSQLAAAAKWPTKVQSFSKFLDDQLQSSSAANPDVANMLREIRKQIDTFGDNFSPGHLQQIRANLSGSSFAMGNNPLKAAPRDSPATVSLLKKVDGILNDVTNGQWQKVVEGYSKDSAPVNASRAAAKVRGAFMDEETGRLLKTTQDGIPRVTEAALTSAMNAARAPNKSLMLSPTANNELEALLEAIRQQNIVQAVKRSATAGGGSDTVANMMQIGASQIGGPTAGLLSVGRSVARGRVDRQLAGLLQEPSALAPLPGPLLDPSLFLLGYRAAPVLTAD